MEQRFWDNKIHMLTIIRRARTIHLLTFLEGNFGSVCQKAGIDFFLLIVDEKVGITFDPQEAAHAPKTIETIYTLLEIPQGYELAASESLSVQSYSWWMNDQGQWISFYQFTIPENATEDNWIAMELPEMGRESRIIGDYLVEIIRSEGFYHLVWTNNTYAFVLELPDVIDDEGMVKIFMSWQPEPTSS